MRSRKHIILSIVEPPKTRSGRTVRASGAEAVPAPEVKFNIKAEDLNDSEVKDIAKKKDVVVVAPAMPIRLIKPMDLPVAQLADNDNVAWGLDAVGALASTLTGKGIKVAVLDTGIDINHPAFAEIKDKILQKDFTGEGDGDTNGHGTHCAGTIFGRSVAGVRIGVAPGIEDVFIGKVIGSKGGDSLQIYEAINWAVSNNVNVISMSLGIDFPGFVKELHEQEGMDLEPATSVALEGYRRNVLLFEKLSTVVRTISQTGFRPPTIIVAAAGNESNRPKFEIAVSPPAVSEGIISVGALGKKGAGLEVARFSNTGPKLSAPGVGILSAKLGGGLVKMNGTSMATPHVAGVAALWAESLMKINQFNLNQLESSLTRSCITKNLPADEVQAYGAGIIQAPLN